MIALVFCVRKYPHATVEEFRDYWWNKHGPYVAERAHLLNMKSYTQMPALLAEGMESVAQARGTLPPYDGVAMCTWDSMDALKATFSSRDAKRAGRELIEDERRFVDFSRSTIFFTDVKPVVAEGKVVREQA
jgi:hypothetical protein